MKLLFNYDKMNSDENTDLPDEFYPLFITRIGRTACTCLRSLSKENTGKPSIVGAGLLPQHPSRLGSGIARLNSGLGNLWT